jgi:hypothetical protein
LNGIAARLPFDFIPIDEITYRRHNRHCYCHSLLFHLLKYTFQSTSNLNMSQRNIIKTTTLLWILWTAVLTVVESFVSPPPASWSLTPASRSLQHPSRVAPRMVGSPLDVLANGMNVNIHVPVLHDVVNHHWTVSSLSSFISSLLVLFMPDDAIDTNAIAAADAITSSSSLSPTTTWIVFVMGIIPFAWATIEFWRRIAVGASFGTGSDSVVFTTTIGQDDAPASSRGRRVLGTGALTVAYILFAVATAVIGLVVWSVVTTGDSMPSMPIPTGTVPSL